MKRNKGNARGERKAERRFSLAKPKVYEAITGKPIGGIPEGAWRIGDSDAGGYLVGPAFFDPQVNGFAGIDFEDPTITRDELEAAVQAIRKFGCSHFLLTIITAPDERIQGQLRKISGFLAASPFLRNAILGFHLEGPCLSDLPGYIGAHSRESVAGSVGEPDWHRFKRWQVASGNRIRMLTIAPERRGAIDLIRRAAASGVVVACGHTNANGNELRAAVEAGATMFTHLGNGCAMQVHRHDNIIQRVLAIPGFVASLIPDGIHLPPAILSNLTRSLGPARLVMTTDCVSPAGGPPGNYRIGDLDVVVGDDKVVMNPDRSSFAGSALTMMEGYYNCIRFGGLGADAAWHAWTWLRRKMFPGVEAPMLAVPFPCLL